MKGLHYIAVAVIVVVLASTAVAQRPQRGRGGAPPQGRGDRGDVQQGPFGRGSERQQPPRTTDDRRQNDPEQQQPAPQTRVRGPGPHAGDWLRRYMGLPADQQQKQLEQDPAFKQLPPDRQERLRQRLNNFNQLSPDRKQRVLNRMQLLDHLTPEQQQRTRELYQQFRGLDPERKGAVLRALRRLREMDPGQRQRAFDSPMLRNNFSDQERELLKGLTDIGDAGDAEAMEAGPGE